MSGEASGEMSGDGSATRFGRSGRSGSRWVWLTRAGLAVALCAGAAAVGLGAGYRSSNALLSGGSTHVQKGHKVAHVNADNREADARTAKQLAKGSERLEVVEVRPGVVYVVNHDTGEVYQMPTDTLDPKLVERREASKRKMTVVSGGNRSYLVDSKQGRLTALDDRTNGKGGDVDTGGEPVDQAVVDSHGTAWAMATRSGELYTIVDAKVVFRQRVTPGGGDALLTLAGDRPVVYQPSRGVAGVYDREKLRRRIDIPATGPSAVSAPGAEVPTLAVVARRTAELFIVDFTSGATRQLRLTGREGHDFGRPVVFGDRLYVPDHSSRHVVVVDLDPLRLASYVPVPGTDAFDVFARDGRVWVNDPYARRMLSFDRRGRPTQIDKGPGDGVRDEPDPHEPVPPATPPVTPPDAPAQPARPDSATPARPSAQPTAPRWTEVPEVVSMNVTKACQALKQAGLECVAVARPDGDADTGDVLGTDPPKGSRVRRGTKVSVFYRGPAQVPNVVSLPVDQACRALQQARLGCSEHPSGATQNPNEIGHVTSQQPAAGAPVTTGSVVTVTHPNAAVVPNVVNASPTDACNALQSLRLQCPQVADEAQPTWQANVVHVQGVAAGSAVPFGTPVQITYEKDAAVQLLRYKADGVESRQLSPGGAARGPNWSPMGSVGGVYQSKDAVPGLVGIYEWVCDGADRDLLLYARHNDEPANQPGSMCVSVRTPVFFCFDNEVAGQTKPLMSMYKDFPKGRRWAVAPKGSAEYRVHIDNGYRDLKRLCHVWHGVPGYPG